MKENENQYEQEILNYYTELIKTTYLKENPNLGINARNKIIAQYNRLMQAEKVAEVNAMLTRIGDENTLRAVSTGAYIASLEKVSPLLFVYANVKVYIAIKSQFVNETVDPLHIIATFDSSIWKHENIQNYANAALEYNKYEAMLSSAIETINKQTSIQNNK